jgi:hypothetical protein
LTLVVTALATRRAADVGLADSLPAVTTLLPAVPQAGLCSGTTTLVSLAVTLTVRDRGVVINAASPGAQPAGFQAADGRTERTSRGLGDHRLEALDRRRDVLGGRPGRDSALVDHRDEVSGVEVRL